MIAAPTPANDAERLAAVRALEILDTPAEERFDRVTRLATRLFDVPMAYVSVVDADRQWFKSACGLTQGSETGRDISFCGHAINGDQAMIIPDALLDPRFADNPLVTGKPHLRFYAGQPISAAGQKIGTFCIADRRPRQLADGDLAALQELAGLVERELTLTDVIRIQNDLILMEEKAAAAERARSEALEKLVESQKHLARELDEAAQYVRSLLPAPIRGDVITDWLFHPCSQLGGDALGYHWLDKDHLAIYLLDVCGHGVGSALLSISAMNALRAGTLPGTDFHDPAAVLKALNAAFPMDRNDGKFFTIWYGAYEKSSRTLHYASGGHPPPLLTATDSAGAVSAWDLDSDNMFIGLDIGAPWESNKIPVPPHSRLYVFSDGAFEVPKPAGGMMSRDDLAKYLAASRPDAQELQRTFDHVRAVGGGAPLPDDFSLLRLVF